MNNIKQEDELLDSHWIVYDADMKNPRFKIVFESEGKAKIIENEKSDLEVKWWINTYSDKLIV
jgi:hypothetical protein